MSALPLKLHDASKGLLDRVRAAPYAALSLVVFIAAGYLCLVNLDYAALWHDEAPAALIGKNLLERGDITGWDGRNLVGGANGRTLNEELRDVLPPLMYVLNAVGFSVFGVNETGARIMHALIGILSLGVLHLLLRQHLPKHPRLVFFLFLFAAWSPQLLLYFRQSRYYAFMVFGMVAGFYLCERYWRTGKPVWLAGLTLVAALSFFNHYTGGAATMLSLASYYLLFRTRETTRRQWLAFAGCGLFVAASGAAYLAFVGVIGSERSGFIAFTGVTGLGGYRGTTPLVLLRLWIYTRDLFTADWVAWPVLVWFAGMLLLLFIRRRGAAREARNPPGDSLPLSAAGRIILVGALFALFSAVLSVQPVWVNPVADLRYYVAALPLLLAMKGVCAEWAWRKSRIAGVAVTAVLLFSSAGAAPFNMTMFFSGERTLGLHLFEFVLEIHRPYRDSIRAVSDYLLEHAEQDDLVYVPGFGDREAMVFTTGHRVLFCCMLDERSHLPPDTIEALGAHLQIRGNAGPDWIVSFGKLRQELRDKLKASYAIAELDVYPYPTQRPELNMHAFTPLPMNRGVAILRPK